MTQKNSSAKGEPSSVGKVILITGASAGIGKATAKKLLQEGHIVYGAARKVEKMKDLEPAGLKILRMDVTNDEDLKNGVQKIINEQGRIDVLFNNAGFGLYGTVEETSIDDARYQFEVNIFGLARLTQLVLPLMRKQNSGTIINTSSMGGKVYTPLGAWYHATKHALEGWSDCLRLELKQFNIDVVIIEPGAIATEFGDVMMEPMLDRSGNGPYKELAEKSAKATRNAYDNPDDITPPSVIADVVSKVINSDKPKTRYAAGKYAKQFMLMRKILTDRAFDKLVMSQFK